MTACRRCRGEGYVGEDADMRLCPTCWGEGDNGIMPDTSDVEVAS